MREKRGGFTERATGNFRVHFKPKEADEKSVAVEGWETFDSLIWLNMKVTSRLLMMFPSNAGNFNSQLG